MSELKIVVADDVESLANRWVDDIRKVASVSGDVRALANGKLEDACRKLADRRSTARSSDAPSDDIGVFDDVDIAVVDYDLLDVTSVTGAQMAYLLRSYSGCKVIVELNRYGENTFDLNLDGRAGDYSDLLIGSEQLGNPGLWKEPWHGYRPWNWPLLPLVPNAHERRTKAVRGNLDQPILEVLDLPSELKDVLPREAIEFILPPGEEDPLAISKVTFRKFVDEAIGGKEGKDRLDDEGYVQVASARVYTWLNRIIIPRQDILVDAPHLVSRYPSLLKDATTIESWNNTARLSTHVGDLGLDLDPIEKYRWQSTVWIDRPVWYWPQLNRDEGILEISRPAERAEYPYVFCENISAFLPREMAQDFRSELSSPFRRRFIASLELKADQSAVVVSGGPEDHTQVEYTPKVALAY